MGRPGDWSVLGYSGDPIDADADEIKDEATHYELVADAITSQIATLRHLAHEGVGDYADALRDSCDKLANNLEKAEGRFRTVAEELNKLVPEVDEALSETHLARIQAENAQSSLDRAVQDGYDPHAPALPPGEEPPPGTVDPRVLRQRVDSAESALGAARTRAQSAVGAWKSVAETAAERIRKAADDDMKDGRFEGFKAWVKKHADLLREISTWLGRIVLVLTVVILLLSNPAGWLIAVALLASVALLAVDTMLALAGEGSWTDVALSALGVLTLGAGSAVAALARLGRSASLFRAGSRSGASAWSTALRNSFNKTGWFARTRTVGAALNPMNHFRAIGDGLRTLSSTMRTPVLPHRLLDPRNLVFGRQNLAMSDDLARLASTVDNIKINSLHSGATDLARSITRVGSINTYVDTALDELDNLGIDVLGIDERTKREVGSL